MIECSPCFRLWCVDISGSVTTPNNRFHVGTAKIITLAYELRQENGKIKINQRTNEKISWKKCFFMLYSHLISCH